jgi:hypothetical protein
MSNIVDIIVINKQYVFLPGGQDSEGRRNDGLRTVGILA